mgnify:CR=1 FL=1
MKKVFTHLLVLSALFVFSSKGFAHQKIEFEDSFKWCVSSSAHQIEGGNDQSDWWDWELLPGKTRKGASSGSSVDHWNNTFLDAYLLKSLKVNQYRMSIEWAKIEPEQGQWDWQVVAHYVKEFAYLKLAGVEPVVTLHHYTFPRWVRENGGWRWSGINQAFTRYASFLYSIFGSQVKNWITIHHPVGEVVGGYLTDLFPPGVNNFSQAVQALRGMLTTHADVYHLLHELAEQEGEELRVGVAKQLRAFSPYFSWDPLDVQMSVRLDEVFNWMFIDAIDTGVFKFEMRGEVSVNEVIPGLKGTQDFLGANYFSRDMVDVSLFGDEKFNLRVKDDAPVSDVGWEIYPQGLLELLKEAHKRYPKLAIWVTENAVAASDDKIKIDYIKSHLKSVHEAMEAGVPVEGYCYGSFIDGFEWNDGFDAKYGLFRVEKDDQNKQLRHVTDTVKFWIDIMDNKGFESK